MKRYRMFLAAAVLAVLLAACGGSAEPVEEDIPQTAQESPKEETEVKGAESEAEEPEEAPEPSGEEGDVGEADSEAAESAKELNVPETIPEGTETETVYATSRVNIRTAPSTEAEIYGMLGVRQTAERVEDDGEWSKIALDGQA